MHPEFFTIPGLGLSIKTYGFFLTVGFLSAVWLAMRRAERVRVNPDHVLDLSFIALVAGVGGARLFYVVHYWHTDFAHAPNVLFRIIDIRQGGLEFLGGLLGAMLAMLLFLWIKKRSIRLYLDILAPGAMWGLAFGRLGCFFNGCCFGGLCVTAATPAPLYPWAVQFPYGSPAHVRQWEERLVTVPAELINSRGPAAFLLPASTLALPIEKIEGPRRDVERAEQALATAKEQGAPADQIAQLTKLLEAAKSRRDAARQSLNLDELEAAQRFPSRLNPKRRTSVTELQQLAAQCKSLPVHPTQLYSSINGFILAGLLSAVFYFRRRHGLVIGLLVVLYPISRILEEMIRVDNPHDTAGLTISQAVSLLMFVAGCVFLTVLYRRLPAESPRIADETPFYRPAE